MSATHPARSISSRRGITLLELLAATAVLTSAVVAAVGATRAARAVLADHPHTPQRDRAEQALERWRGVADRVPVSPLGEAQSETWTWIDPDGGTWSIVAELTAARPASSPEPAPMEIDAVWAIVRVARSSVEGPTIHVLERPALVSRPPEAKSKKDAAS